MHRFCEYACLLISYPAKVPPTPRALFPAGTSAEVILSPQAMPHRR